MTAWVHAARRLVFLFNFSFSNLCLLYSNCCQSSMQSSSISAWCSQPQRTKTDRYLALVSLLSWLPLIINASLRSSRKFPKLSERSYLHIRMILLSIFLINSIVNPVIYAMRMPEFRASVSQIFCGTSGRIIQPDLPLRNLRPA